jgi:hypothetical protein
MAMVVFGRSRGYLGQTYRKTETAKTPINLRIEKYTGAKAINTLKFYPIKYHVDKNGKSAVEELRNTLKKRGEKFRRFCTAPKGSQLFYCDAPVISRRTGYDDMDESNSYVS